MDRVLLEPITSFVAKTQDPSKDDRRFGAFRIPSIPKDDKGEKSNLCPVRCLKAYWKRTKDIKRPSKRLFINTQDASRTISKNSISKWIRDLIYISHKRHNRIIRGKVKAHSVRGVGATLSFKYNRSLYQVLKAGSWTKHNTFTKFYLKKFSLRKMERLNLNLGPIVAAQSIVGEVKSK